MSEAKRPRRDRRTSIDAIVPLGAVVLFVASFIGLDMTTESIQPETKASAVQVATPSPTPTLSPRVAVSHPTTLPTSTSTPAQDNNSQPLAAPPLRLVYKAAGIDLPVASMNQATGPFIPPEEKEMSYWLGHYGKPGRQSNNTTYIIAHSAELEKWPFNALSTATHKGDMIEVTTSTGVVKYKVSDVSFYPKHDLETDGKTPVWDIDPRLLRLIGCKDGDVWQQVTVVTATIVQ